MNRETILPERFAKWLAITFACALPLFLLVMFDSRGSLLLPVILGIATWAAGMTLLDARLDRRRPAQPRSLMKGFTTWAIVHGVLSLVAYCAGIGAVFAPYVASAIPGLAVLAALDVSGPWEADAPVGVYVLTVSCGLFDFVAGLLTTAIVAANRSARDP